MTKRHAEKIQAGDVVIYAHQRFTVTSISTVDGPKPPYFTLASNKDEPIQVTYLLCQPAR